MKILDRYILSRFLFNLVSSFVIMMFIFIFQSIWLFIDDLAGKGLDMMIIGKFFFYKMPELTEKVLPLTVLLSSILTFGTFAENYEFAAMKASGISLKRAMISIILFVVALGGMTFFFANSVIPASEQKIFNLRRNIAKLKPAVAIAEGVFSDFESADMNIKVDNKYGENDRFLENVIIHQKTKTNINYRVIKAKAGELISGGKSDIIQLVLKDGHLYQAVESKGADKQKYPFAKSKFETYTMNIDLTEFNNVDLEEERDIETAKMKNIARLGKDIDSLKKDNLRIVKAFSKNVVTTKIGAFDKLPEKNSKEAKREIITEKKEQKKDSLKNKELVEDIVSLYPEWQQVQVLNTATNTLSGTLTTIKGKRIELGKRYELHRRHIFSLHDKFALAFSCIILFFVGAPLGAIIRKGGLGLPMVIAIVLFLIYYFVGVFAENYSNKGNIHPILGAWTSTLLMLPLGVFLTIRATADKGLLSFSNVIDKFTSIFKRKKEKYVDVSTPEENYNQLSNLEFDLSQQVFKKEELELLNDSLNFISNYSSNLNDYNIEEFLAIHRRNRDGIIRIGKTDKSGFFFEQVNNYPDLEYAELYEHLTKSSNRNKFSLVEFLMYLYDRLTNDGKPEDDIEFKLKKTRDINNIVILSIESFLFDAISR